MSALKPITIIGGGLAGLTLGIGLRQRGIPVTIWEAGRYPRHRVCGEFISGNGQHVLERLGLRSKLEQAGAIQLRTVQFITGDNRSPIRELPPAIGLSRYDLDHLLATEFQNLGGELREGERWIKEPSKRVGQAFQPASSGDFPVPGSSKENANTELEAGKLREPAGWKAYPTREGIVHASGRRAQPTEDGYRWFGLKIHARNVKLATDLEMHVARDSYVGVNRINNDEINVCGLFRSRPGEAPSDRGMYLLRGATGSSLQDRLKNAIFDEQSFCSVAGLSLKRHRASDAEELCIGDALTMIPPVTGNGMSMAFESAELAIAPLETYSRGELTWQRARQMITHACDRAFAPRLRWAHWLQHLMFSPLIRSPMGGCLLRSDSLWQLFFSRTR
jgi:hypothetical protein